MCTYALNWNLNIVCLLQSNSILESNVYTHITEIEKNIKCIWLFMPYIFVAWFLSMKYQIVFIKMIVFSESWLPSGACGLDSSSGLQPWLSDRQLKERSAEQVKGQISLTVSQEFCNPTWKFRSRRFKLNAFDVIWADTGCDIAMTITETNFRDGDEQNPQTLAT